MSAWGKVGRSLSYAASLGPQGMMACKDMSSWLVDHQGEIFRPGIFVLLLPDSTRIATLSCPRRKASEES